MIHDVYEPSNRVTLRSDWWETRPLWWVLVEDQAVQAIASSFSKSFRWLAVVVSRLRRGMTGEGAAEKDGKTLTGPDCTLLCRKLDI